MDLTTILDKYGLPIAGCAFLAFALKYLWNAYQEKVKALEDEQKAEIERLEKKL